MKRFFKLMIQITRNYEGCISSKFRLFSYKKLGMQTGQNVYIGPSVYIDYPHKVKIGSDVSIQHCCYISAYGQLIIGNDVSIANGVSIVTSTHPTNIEKTIRTQNLIPGQVSIGDNVWIGMKSSILHQVTIGDNVIIGAHSLVNRNIPSNSIAYGVPCKKAFSK